MKRTRRTVIRKKQFIVALAFGHRIRQDAGKSASAEPWGELGTDEVLNVSSTICSGLIASYLVITDVALSRIRKRMRRS